MKEQKLPKSLCVCNQKLRDVVLQWSHDIQVETLLASRMHVTCLGCSIFFFFFSFVPWSANLLATAHWIAPEWHRLQYGHYKICTCCFFCVCVQEGLSYGFILSFFFFCQNRSKRKTYETYGTWTLFNIAQMRAETRREAASVCTHRNRDALNLSGNHMNIVFSFLFWGGLGVTGCWSAYFAQYSNHAVITSWNEHCVISASTGNHREHILTGIAARSRCWAKWMHWQWHVNYTSEI